MYIIRTTLQIGTRVNYSTNSILVHKEAPDHYIYLVRMDHIKGEKWIEVQFEKSRIGQISVEKQEKWQIEVETHTISPESHQLSQQETEVVHAGLKREAGKYFNERYEPRFLHMKKHIAGLQ